MQQKTGDEHAQVNETITGLRQQLSIALEMLQIMLEELQAAHAALSSHRPNEAADD